MKEEMFISEKNQLLLKTYKDNDNYFVRHSGGGTHKICIIYFSGNNLYFPNTDDVFTRKIIENDRYEWTYRGANFSDNLNVKEIFVRDIYKQWYVKGINSRISSIDNLIDLLGSLSEGTDELITVGNSAGGYMSALIGCKLNASRVFCFSGQFNLYDRIDSYPVLKSYCGTENEKYFDITPIIHESNVPIYYFYPFYAEEDSHQSSLVLHENNVYSFAFNQHTHGLTMYVENLGRVLALEEEKLNSLARKYKGKVISPFLWSLHIDGVKNTLRGLIVNSSKRVYMLLSKNKKLKQVLEHFR